jgi:hypothetical protein
MADSHDRSASRRPATPRWVKVIAIALVAGLILALVLTLTSGGQHGPGVHTGSASTHGPVTLD